jgi:NAD(P)-dependent dehydrogenase (short-subunit alcohol dehydrogenase family)
MRKDQGGKGGIIVNISSMAGKSNKQGGKNINTKTGNLQWNN